MSSGATGKGMAAPAPEGRQGPLTSAASDYRDGELSRKEKADDTRPPPAWWGTVTRASCPLLSQNMSLLCVTERKR